MARIFTLIIVLLLASPVFGESVTKDSIVGKWNFTHMLLDGETSRKVNRIMEFLSSGEIVNFDATGSERGRASYKIASGSILYIDERGEQKWKVRKFDGKHLHVNHRGADMFFERTS